jgi:hypothetical protein
MSFKKQQPYQPDMFKVPLLPSRSEKYLYDPKASHNLFYHNVYCKIPEDIFTPLYCTGNGRPNANVRLLVAMRIFKEGGGYSDQEMFEAMRFDILVRKSMGLMSFEDKVPTESTYYKFFAAICEYQAKTGIDLYEEACKHVTKKQLEEYNISARKIRLDSTLIGGNIAHYSRYRIVHTTLVKAVRMPGNEVSLSFSESVRACLKAVLEENAEHTCYELSTADMRVRFLQLGQLVQQVLAEAKAASLAGFELLERVFGEQYRTNADTGSLEAIPSKEISARSMQNPNDPDATYRSKNGEEVRGYTHNVTETCDDEDKATTASGKKIKKPKLIVHVDVQPASTPDTDLYEPGVKGAMDVTGQKPESSTADGGYQSAQTQGFADSEGIEAVFTGFQGREGAYDLELSPNGESLQATKRATGEKLPTSMTKSGSWRIEDVKDGKKHTRYVTKESVAASMRRKAFEAIPKAKRWLRNNVEATIFQLTFHTRNNKTRYRGLMKQKIFALSRCLWVNCVRLSLFEARMAV